MEKKRRLTDQFLCNLETFQYLLVIFDMQIFKQITNITVCLINSHVYSDLRIEKLFPMWHSKIIFLTFCYFGSKDGTTITIIAL